MLADPKWTTLFIAIGSQKLRYFPPFRRRIADADDLLFAEIGERHLINVSERQDILSLLMGATHNDGSPMSDHELRDELLTLLELARKRLADYLGASSAAGAAR